MDSRQLSAVTVVGENSAPRARPNPFKRAPAVSVGAALAFAAIANFMLPFASFEGRRTAGEGGPSMMSNDSSIPRPKFPEGVCRVPEEDSRPTMNAGQGAKE